MEVIFSDGSREQYEDQPFSEGAQGAIYRSRDRQHVVKLYKTPANLPANVARQLNLDRQRQLDAIIGQYNVVGNDPYWDELFAWPLKRATAPRIGVSARFITGLTRLDNYFFAQSFNRLTEAQRGWWIGRVASSIKLARAVGRLSTRGLCHSDLSEKNIFVDPLEGRATILDCDSLVIPNVMPAEVLGTPEYMAPELQSGKVREPSVVTDRHALAVLLYRWLLYRHPLLGPKRHSNDPQVDDNLALGERALYIENPTDTSNRPSNLQVTTNALSPRVRDLFQRAFVGGLHNSALRPTADLWEEALSEMFDRVVPCANAACEQRYFVAPDMGPLICTLCGTRINAFTQLPYLKLRGPRPSKGGAIEYVDETAGANGVAYSRYIVGWPDRLINTWHVDPTVTLRVGLAGTRPDNRRLAVIRHDRARNEWFLENIAIPQLQARQGGGAPSPVGWAPVPLGQRVALRTGTQLLLGALNSARIAYVELRPV